MNVKKTTLILGLLGAAALLTLTGCIPLREATRTLTESFDVLGIDTVDLDARSSNGSVSVRGIVGATTVEVTATLRSRGSTLAEASVRVAQIDVTMTQSGDRILLEYDATDHPLGVRTYSGVDFEVTVPVAVDVDVDTSNGSIRIDDVAGILGLDTSNGRITVADAIGDLDAETSNGTIEIERFEGLLRAETSNGRIEIDDFEGAVDATTSNGPIQFSGALIDTADHRLVTSNGRIDVDIPSDASLRIVAQTSNGSISTTLPLIGDTDGRAWDAVLNPPATGTLTLETSNSGIAIESL